MAVGRGFGLGIASRRDFAAADKSTFGNSSFGKRGIFQVGNWNLGIDGSVSFGNVHCFLVEGSGLAPGFTANGTSVLKLGEVSTSRSAWRSASGLGSYLVSGSSLVSATSAGVSSTTGADGAGVSEVWVAAGELEKDA